MLRVSGRLLAGVAISALFAIGCGGDNGGAGGRSGSGGAGRGGTTGHAGTGGGTGGAGATGGTAGTTGTAGTGGSGGGGTGGGGTTGSAGTGGAAGTAGSGGGGAGGGGTAGTGGAAGTAGSGGGGTTGSAGTSGTTSINCGGRAAWLGDFDGDGVADCARAQAGAGTQLDLVFNKGVSSGLYLAAAVITPDVVAPDYLTGSSPALVFDLNHDSRQDIVIGINFPANPSAAIQSYLQFFRGHADGTFDRHDPSFNLVIGDVIRWQPAFADFDGDGFADTIAASAQLSLYSDFYFYVLKSTGGSDFRVAAGGGVHTLRGTAGVIRAADLNGDGKLDLVVHAVPNPAAMTLGMPSYLAVALAVSDASFSEAVRISGTDGATTAQVSDVNTDGKPDLLVTLPAGSTPFYGNGAGQFSTSAP